MKKSAILLSTLILVGCAEPLTHKGPIQLPESQVGVKSPVIVESSGISTIFVEYQNEFNIGKSELDFQPRGIIDGKSSPMIPLGKSSSQLEALGFITHISIDGEEAVLEYNDTYLKFKTEQKTIFVNDADSYQIADAPFYNNSTIYVPLLPILDILKLDYKIEGPVLTIGGHYTDATGKPYTGNRSTDTPQ